MGQAPGGGLNAPLLRGAEHSRDPTAARVGDGHFLRTGANDRLDVPVPSPVHELVAARDERRAHRRFQHCVRLFHKRVGRQQLVVDARCCDG